MDAHEAFGRVGAPRTAPLDAVGEARPVHAGGQGGGGVARRADVGARGAVRPPQRRSATTGRAPVRRSPPSSSIYPVRKARRPGWRVARRGFRPVRRSTRRLAAEGATVPMFDVLRALVAGADELLGQVLQADAPPAFLVDSRRAGEGFEVRRGMFDNRSVLRDGRPRRVARAMEASARSWSSSRGRACLEPISRASWSGIVTGGLSARACLPPTRSIWMFRCACASRAWAPRSPRGGSGPSFAATRGTGSGSTSRRATRVG